MVCHLVLGYFWLILKFICIVDNMLPEWKQFPLHPQLFSSLYKQKFTKPTPIQESTLPVAIKGKDVVGIAQTVSYQTLVSIYKIKLIIIKGIWKNSWIWSTNTKQNSFFTTTLRKKKAQSSHPYSHSWIGPSGFWSPECLYYRRQEENRQIVTSG